MSSGLCQWLAAAAVVMLVVVVAALVRVGELFLTAALTGGALAMGRDKPRSLPRLATPTPQVSCVLYPEHSLPTSRHCEQYGLLLSHLTLRLVQAKQSSEAPPAGARLLRFRAAAVSGFGAAACTGDEDVMLN